MSHLDIITKLSTLMLAAAAALAASPAMAEIVKQDENGFYIAHEVEVTTDADAAYEMLRAPAKWWSARHSWTGDAENFYMDAQATGCFCELIPASTEGGLRGSVEHMRIVYAEPGKNLRLSGGLGPLQAEAVQGSLSISLKPSENGTIIKFEYVVGGYMRFPVEQIAPAVDGVIGEQISRLGGTLGMVEAVNNDVSRTEGDEALQTDSDDQSNLQSGVEEGVEALKNAEDAIDKKLDI